MTTEYFVDFISLSKEWDRIEVRASDYYSLVQQTHIGSILACCYLPCKNSVVKTVILRQTGFLVV